MIVFRLGTVSIEFLPHLLVFLIESPTSNPKKTLDQKKQVHIRKFQSLAPKLKNRKQPASKTVVNLSSYSLSESENTLFSKGLLVLSKLPSEICEEKTQTLLVSRQQKSCTQHAQEELKDRSHFS